MKTGDYLHPAGIIPDLSASTKEDVLKKLVEKLREQRDDIDGEELLSLLLERERLGSTGIGGGIAIPHAKMRNIGKPVVVFGRCVTGIAYNSIDGNPVRLIFLLVADADSIEAYLKSLARISRQLKNRDFCARLLEATDVDTLYGIIEEQDSRL